MPSVHGQLLWYRYYFVLYFCLLDFSVYSEVSTKMHAFLFVGPFNLVSMPGHCRRSHTYTGVQLTK